MGYGNNRSTLHEVRVRAQRIIDTHDLGKLTITLAIDDIADWPSTAVAIYAQSELKTSHRKWERCEESFDVYKDEDTGIYIVVSVDSSNSINRATVHRSLDDAASYVAERTIADILDSYGL